MSLLHLSLLLMPVWGHGLLLPFPEAKPRPVRPYQVYRTILPESGPSAFAIGFSNGVSLAFDPVRGGITYAWKGGFLDLSPTWTKKNIQPARLIGEVFFHQTIDHPLRRRSPDQVPKWQFLGYRLLEDYPEFHFLLDGQAVRQSVRPLSHPRMGIEVIFKVKDKRNDYWFLIDPVPGIGVSSPQGKWEEDRFHFSGTREFSLEIIYEEDAGE